MKKWNISFILKNFIIWGWRKLRGDRHVEVTRRLNGTTFYLNSPVFDDAEYESEEAKTFHNNARAKFESGELFLPLKIIPESGGIVIALISERGMVSKDHMLAMYPTYMEESKCRRKEPY